MGQYLLVNPKTRSKPKRKKAKRKSIAVASRKTVSRKYRRNPIRGGGSAGLVAQVKNAAIGAGGALVVDILMNKLPLPANMKAGALRPAAQGLVSLGLGYLVGRFGKNRSLGNALAAGGLNVALYGLFRSQAAKIPALGLSGVDDGLLGYESLSGDLLGYESLSEYDLDDGMGWYSAAPVSPGFSDYD